MNAATTSSDHSEMPAASRHRSARRKSISSSSRSIRDGRLDMPRRVKTASDGPGGLSLQERSSLVDQRERLLQELGGQNLRARVPQAPRKVAEALVTRIDQHERRSKLVACLLGARRI